MTQDAIALIMVWFPVSVEGDGIAGMLATVG
jgi:hypothetical protein